MGPAASCPPLQKTQERGTHSLEKGRKIRAERAGHPSKRQCIKGGPPAKRQCIKGGPPALGQL